jgi:hypothetical protein
MDDVRDAVLRAFGRGNDRGQVAFESKRRTGCCSNYSEVLKIHMQSFSFWLVAWLLKLIISGISGHNGTL